MCVLPVPGAPCSRMPRLRCWPLASSRRECLATPSTCRSMFVQQLVGQHDLVAADAWASQEIQRRLPRRPEHLGAEADHLAAEQAPSLPSRRISRRTVSSLALAPLRRPAGSPRRAGPREAGCSTMASRSRRPHQVDAVADARVGLPVRPAGQAVVTGAPTPAAAERAVRRRLEEIADRDVVEPHVPDPGDAEHLVAPPGIGRQPGVHADLQVDVLVQRMSQTVGSVAASGPRWSSSTRRSGWSSCAPSAPPGPPASAPAARHRPVPADPLAPSWRQPRILRKKQKRLSRTPASRPSRPRAAEAARRTSRREGAQAADAPARVASARCALARAEVTAYGPVGQSHGP